MKYSEFKRDIEAMGYSIFNGSGTGDLYVRKGKYRYLISVGIRSTYVIDSKFESFRDLEYLEKERLLALAWRLASTPLDEREDEKRYRLKLPFVRSDYGYLNQVRYEKQLTINNKFESNAYKAIFTESEIKELKQKNNLDSFVMEEVLEDE